MESALLVCFTESVLKCSCLFVHAGVICIVSAMLVLVTVYFIAPLFEALPLCVLASIVIVACIPLFVHYTMWRIYWRTDYYDFAIWVATAFGTFLAGVDYGMIIGIAFSVLAINFRLQVKCVVWFAVASVSSPSIRYTPRFMLLT